MRTFERNAEFLNPNLDQTSLKNNIRLIGQLARKSLGRLEANGIYEMEYDDVFQDMSLSLVKAQASFSEEAGNRFSTYLVSAARHNFNKVAERQIAYHQLVPKSIEEIDPEGKWLVDRNCENDDFTPEESLLQKEAIRYVGDRLSKFAKAVLACMINPPELLMQEFRLEHENAKFFRDNGCEKRTASSLTIDIVIRFLSKGKGLNDRQVKRLVRAVRAEYLEVTSELERN